MRVQIKNIMCLTDLSNFSNRTIDYGLALAKEFDSKLYLSHIVDIPSIALYAEAHIDPVEQQNQIIDHAHTTLADLAGKQDKEVQWEPLVTVGPTVSEISRLVSEKDIDLAISASHGRSGLKRLVLGSVTEELMRTLSCPLLVVRGPEEDGKIEKPPAFRLDKIMVGSDFSPDSSFALRYALSLAQEFESEIHLVHVVEPPAYRDHFRSVVEAEKKYHHELLGFLKGKLENMVPEDAGNWCTSKTELLEGQPYSEIIEYAGKNDINLIVLGVRGHGLVETFFMGSTTDRVMRRAPCPVLSVRAASS